MRTSKTSHQTETRRGSVYKNLKGFKSKKKAVIHLYAAEKSNLEAREHYEAGNHLKAAKSTITAQDHFNLAIKAQKADLKKHNN